MIFGIRLAMFCGLLEIKSEPKMMLDLQSPDSPELRYPDPIEGFLSNLELAGQSNLATVS